MGEESGAEAGGAEAGGAEAGGAEAGGAEAGGGATVAGATPEIEDEGGSSCRNCGIGCVGIVMLALIGGAVANAGASARLDARFQLASEEVFAAQEKAAEPRQTLLGGASNDANGAVDYQGLEWVFAGGNPEHLRLSWRSTRPELPDDVDAMVKTCSPDGEEIDAVATAYVIDAYVPRLREDGSYAVVKAGRKKKPVKRINGVPEKDVRKGLATYARFAPSLRYVRDGLSRGRCDWKTRLEMGMRVEIPNLLYIRGAANMMAYEATLQPPKEALTTGLQIVAFGGDIARQGTLISDMIAVAVSSIGFRSLMHTMGRPGLGAADYQRIVDALGRFQPPSVDESLQREKLAAVISALELSGRRLDKNDPNAMSSDAYEAPFLAVDFFHARELEGYEYFMDKNVAIGRLPEDQRAAAYEALEKELDASWLIIVKIAMPNLSEAGKQLDQTLSLARATRVVAAAHLKRIESGSFPVSLDALSALVGKEGTIDLSREPAGPLGYRASGEEVACWIAGRNGKDDGGPAAKSGDDAGIRSHFPKEPKVELPAPEDPNEEKSKKRKGG